MPFEEVTIGSARLIRGDCREALPTLSQADCLVTDPPYGVSLGLHLAAKDRRINRVLVKDGYASYDDTAENYRDIVAPALIDALALTTRGLIFVAGKMAWDLPRPDAIGGVFLPAGCGRNRWGFASFSHALLYGMAPELHKGAKPTGISSTVRAEKNGHPCPKPLPWMLWAVRLASVPEETVLDPFMGSGTTGVACAQLGRAFIGIEIEPRYFDIACQRIETAHTAAKEAA